MFSVSINVLFHSGNYIVNCKGAMLHVGMLVMLCSFMTTSAALGNSRDTGGGGMLEYSLAYVRELESTTRV